MKQEAVDKLLETLRKIRIDRQTKEWSGFKETDQKHMDIQDITCPGEISILSIRPEKQEAILDCSVCRNSICYKYQPSQKP